MHTVQAVLLWVGLLLVSVSLLTLIPNDAMPDFVRHGVLPFGNGMVLYCVAYGYKRFLDLVEDREKKG